MSSEELFEQNKYLAGATLKHMFKAPAGIAKKNGILLEDLEQYAYEALWQACITYNPNKSKFKTHAINVIIRHVARRLHLDCRTMTYDKKAKNAPKPEELYKITSIDEEVKNTDYHSLHEMIGSDVYIENDVVFDMLNKDILSLLTEKEKIILHMKLEGETTYTIGDYLGMTHQNVSASYKRVKGKIKQYFIKVRLNDIYGVCG